MVHITAIAIVEINIIFMLHSLIAILAFWRQQCVSCTFLVFYTLEITNNN